MFFGVAQAATVALGPGSHSIRAAYSGGGGYAPSVSAPFPDLVTAKSGAGFGASVPYAAGVDPGAVATGDFNRDGRADVAVADSSNHAVQVLLGTGTGTFSPAAPYATGAHR